jgi:RNA polymerase sigma-70 factor (ECF subfamily)
LQAAWRPARLPVWGRVKVAAAMSEEPDDHGAARGGEGAEAHARLFEAERLRLRGLAFRMLGSLADADDVVQEAWLRLGRTRMDPGRPEVNDLPAWLTTVTARLALDALRSRRRRGEEPLPAGEEVEPHAFGAAGASPGSTPEEEAILAEQVGLALLVVLDRLAPAERLAFVLHDAFGLPFEQVAAVLGRTPEAARQAASRARRRVRGKPPGPAARANREVVAAFARAAREGDLPALVRLLDPDVTLRVDPVRLPFGAPAEVRGAQAVASRARMGAMGHAGHLVLVDGRPALAVAPGGRLELVITFEVVGERIVRIEAIAEPSRLAALPLALPAEPAGTAPLPKSRREH